MSAHGLVERHDDHVICVCGEVIHATGINPQNKALWRHFVNERSEA